MDTSALQGGSATLDGFALGVMAASLAFVTVNSSRKLTSRWWTAGTWQHTMRWARAGQQRARLAVSRRSVITASADSGAGPGGTPAESSRPYSDLSDPAGLEPKKQEPDESFWGPRASRSPAGGYRSKHRIPDGEPQTPGQRDELEQARSHRRAAPRHAAS